MNLLSITATILICLAPSKPQKGAELLEMFQKRFDLMDSLIFTPPIHTLDTAFSYFAAEGVTSVSQLPDSIIQEKVADQIKEFKAQTGLQLTGQTYYRLDETLSFDEEDPVPPYIAKMMAELRWYYFQSSLFNRKGNINELRIKGEIEELSHKKEGESLILALQKETFKKRYDSLLFSVLSLRIDNLELLDKAQKHLLESGNISSDELLSLINEKATAQRVLSSLTPQNVTKRELPSIAGMIIHIDKEKYLESVKTHHSSLNLLDLESALIEQKRDNTSYWNELRISPFARYSYYIRSHLPYSHNLDVGVALSIPLDGQTREKRKVLAGEKKVVIAQKEVLQQKIEQEIRLTIEEMEQNNRCMEGEIKRLKELKQYLKQRKEAYSNIIGGYNPLGRIKEYNTYLLSLESMLHYQYLRDCEIAKLQSLLGGDVSIEEFCSITFIDY